MTFPRPGRVHGNPGWVCKKSLIKHCRPAIAVWSGSKLFVIPYACFGTPCWMVKPYCSKIRISTAIISSVPPVFRSFSVILSSWTTGKYWAVTWQKNEVIMRPAKTQISLGIRPVWSVFAEPCRQRRLWSDWADAQADRSLRWAHTHFVGFVMSRLSYVFWQVSNFHLISFLWTIKKSIVYTIYKFQNFKISIKILL